MSNTTSNSMNYLLMKNDDRINAVIPKPMRKMIQEIRAGKGMSESIYIKVALQNQIERDLSETQELVTKILT